MNFRESARDPYLRVRSQRASRREVVRKDLNAGARRGILEHSEMASYEHVFYFLWSAWYATAHIFATYIFKF